MGSVGSTQRKPQSNAISNCYGTIEKNKKKRLPQLAEVRMP